VTSIRLKFVKAYVDRHGKARHYFRKPGCKPVPLPGLVGSPEFLEAYGAALAGEPTCVEVGASRTVAGSIDAMTVGYLGSTDLRAPRARLAAEVPTHPRRATPSVRPPRHRHARTPSCPQDARRQG